MGQRRASWSMELACAALHAAGALGLPAAAVALWLPRDHLSLLWAHRDVLHGHLASMAALSLGCWLTLMVCARRFRAQRTVRLVRMLRRRRGTAMTEFLVILPVMLLLIFGLAQLAINLIGGTLFQVARYEAARAALVWAPEIGAGRGVSLDHARNKVRTAVASVMAPVAPGEYGGAAVAMGDATEMRRIMVQRYLPADASALVNAGAPLSAVLGDREHTFVMALDDSPFPVRAYLKFTHAFGATADVEIEERGDDIAATFVYHHQQAMPVVAWVFGARATVAGRDAYYTSWPGDYVLPRQRFGPNAALPTDHSACSASVSGIGC